MENGLKLFEDLSERRITFTEFLYKFMELPRTEQDRLLATQPQTANTKAPVVKLALFARPKSRNSGSTQLSDTTAG